MRGGVATSGPALVFSKLRVAPSPSTTEAFHATIRPLCAETRALWVSLSPCALGRVGCWMPACRECGPRRFATLRPCCGCPDFRSGRIPQQLRRQRLPLPRPGGVPALGNYSVCFRWLGGDVGNARCREDVTAGETNYSGKLPIILRGPRGCRFGKTASRTDCGASDYFSPTFPQLGSAAGQYRQLPLVRGGTAAEPPPRYRGGTAISDPSRAWRITESPVQGPCRYCGKCYFSLLSGSDISHETVFHTPPRNTTHPQVRSGVFEKSAHHFASKESAPYQMIRTGIRTRS